MSTQGLHEQIHQLRKDIFELENASILETKPKAMAVLVRVERCLLLIMRGMDQIDEAR